MFNDMQGLLASGSALLTFAAGASLIPTPAETMASRQASPRPVNISLTSFDLTPGALHLRAGRPILLRVANDSGLAHDLTAPKFFRAAAIGPADAARVANGKIAVGPHQSVIVAMIPTTGRYSMKCSHAFHKMLGMSGTIVVVP